MRVLICGDRNWTDRDTIERFIKVLSSDTIIIEGECRGADKISREVAEKYSIKVEKYPADWNKYGRAAGPIRNKQMLDEGKPDLVVAFHNNLDQSKGTKDMINQARKRNIPFIVKRSSL